MAYEFKKISDVEVVAEPTDAANVLIEENGVIKKAPKTTVGGNSDWDAIIDLGDLEQRLNEFDAFSISSIDLKFAKGSLEELQTKPSDGLKVLIKYNYVYADECFANYIIMNSFEVTPYYITAKSVYSPDDSGIFILSLQISATSGLSLGIRRFE